MQPSASLGTWVLAWAVIACLVLLIRTGTRQIGTGLVAAYLVDFAMNHWLGGAIYLQPEYARSDPDVVAIGFQQATYGVAAFGLGSLVLAPLLMRLLPPAPRLTRGAPSEGPGYRVVIGLGLAFMLVLLPLAPKVPTLSALLAQGLGVVIVGLGLACWTAWHSRRPHAFLGWLAATLCLPFLTIVTQGFLGFGSVAALAILCFLASFARPRWAVAMTALAIGYVGLSLFVTYMRDRPELRATVATSGINARVAQVGQTLSTFEWFDLSNTDHLDRVDDRLNQNYLVGKAVTYLEAGLVPYAQGDTVWNGLLALIPRAIWPTKPLAAGSPQLVSHFTGLTFAAGTSVGIGNVMEAYVSFGTPGVVIAFALLGAIITLLDVGAGQRLRKGNWRGFLLWYLPALSLVQVTGSVVEVTSSAGAAIIVALIITRLVKRPRASASTRARPAARPAWSRA